MILCILRQSKSAHNSFNQSHNAYTLCVYVCVCCRLSYSIQYDRVQTCLVRFSEAHIIFTGHSAVPCTLLCPLYLLLSAFTPIIIFAQQLKCSRFLCVRRNTICVQLLEEERNARESIRVNVFFCFKTK